MNKIERQRFRKLFGIEAERMGTLLIISPFFSPKLFTGQVDKPQFFKGMLFHGLTGMYKDKKITFIYTGMGQSLVVDCIMAQDNKKVKTMIFLGAVGAVRDLEIGDKLIIEKAFFDPTYYKKFGIKIEETSIKEFFPSKELVTEALNFARNKNFPLKKANTISIHTFLDQGPEVAEKLSRAGIQSVDLECALFYAASKIRQIKAIAACFVSDNILEKPFWGDFSLPEKKQITNNMYELVEFSLEFGHLMV